MAISETNFVLVMGSKNMRCSWAVVELDWSDESERSTQCTACPASDACAGRCKITVEL